MGRGPLRGIIAGFEFRGRSTSSRSLIRMKTYTPKASEIQREWHVVDAEGLILGRLATEVARAG